MSGTYVRWPAISGGSGGGGITTIGSMDAQPASVNGASVGGVNLYMQSATGSNSGLVNITTQAFGGTKIFATAAPIMPTMDLGKIVTVGSSNQLATIAFSPANNNGQIVQRDINGNAVSTNWVSATTTTQSSGTQNIVLNQGSTRVQKVIGSNSIVGGFVLPIATNLYNGQKFELNNNTTQQISIFTAGSVALATAISGSYADIICVDNTTVNGTWDVHWLGQTSGSFVNIGALDGIAASPNALSIATNSLYMQSASTSNPGIVSSAAQTFAGVKTFNGQIIAPGGVGLGAVGSNSVLALGCDVNTNAIILGSTSGTTFYQKIGLGMNSPQAAIHFGSLNGNSNVTSGTVGSYSIILGRMSATNNVGTGAVIIGGYSGGMTASGQGSIAIGDAGCRSEASFAIAMGDGALAQSLASVAIGNGAQVTSAQNNGVAIGINAQVSALNSVAAGSNTTAPVAGQTVVGGFNIPSTGAAGTLGTTDEVFVVGAGTASNARTNVLSCTRDGATRMYTSSGTGFIAHYIGTVSANYSVKWPGSQASGSCTLANDGLGNLSWSTSTGATNGLTIQTFSSGSGQYTPTPGTKAIKITAVGGGGGGGGVAQTLGSNSAAAAGGMSGCTSIKWIQTSSLSASYFYYISDKGPGGAAGTNNGAIGSSTTFYSLSSTTAVIAPGGFGGADSPSTTPPSCFISAGGGLNTALPLPQGTGDIFVMGQFGGNGFNGNVFAGNTSITVSSGNGGSSEFGGGGRGAIITAFNISNSIAGTNATGYGGGGSGAATCGSGGFSQAGGNGTGGLLIIEEYF